MNHEYKLETKNGEKMIKMQKDKRKTLESAI